MTAGDDKLEVDIGAGARHLVVSQFASPVSIGR